MSHRDVQRQMASLLQQRSLSPKDRQAEYAHTVIGHILNRCGGKDVLKQAVKAQKEAHGSPLLTWDFFRATFHDFPINLCSDALPGVKLHADRKASFPRIMTTFKDVPFVRAFVEHRQASQGADLAMVFPRNLIQLGMIIHTGLPETVPARYGTCLMHTTPEVTVYVEPFAAVLAAIHRGGHGWRAVL